MKTKIGFLSIAVLCVTVFFLLTSCEKFTTVDWSEEPEIPKMPPITNTGEDTFGCYINGELFVPEINWDYLGGCGGTFGERGYGHYGRPDQYRSFSINASNCVKGSAVSIKLNAYKIDTGYYELQYNRMEQALYSGEHGAYFRLGEEEFYNTDLDCRGYCQITKFDTLNKIVAGVFAFEACNDSVTLSITEGRFDVHFLY